MKKLYLNSLVAQRGSAYVMIVLLALVGAAVTCALKIAPLYMDHAALTSAMEAMVATKDFPAMPILDIRKEVRRSLQVNNFDGFDTQNIVVTREAGMDYVDVNYEARVNIVANIYAVIEFKDRYNKF
jgi:Domain of unknown function (DUF4845)